MTSTTQKLLPIAQLALLAAVVGLLSGLIAASFRIALVRADAWRDGFIERAHLHGALGFLATIIVISLLVALAAWLTRRFAPDAVGSGIPQVEATIESGRRPGTILLVPIKFIGGWLAIGAGLALGREGPSVQMGATIGSSLSRALRLREPDLIALLSAGAGAGLATAFNAPIAGIALVLEEIVRRFDIRHSIAAFAASGAAIAVARLMIGSSPDFAVDAIGYLGFESSWLFLVLGVVAGIAGVAYNSAILGLLALADRLKRFPVELRAGVIGALVALLAWYAPRLVGGGDSLTQQSLLGREVLATLPLVFLVRFLVGAVSYSAGTPGGLFAPLLTVGAQLGILTAAALRIDSLLPTFPPSALAVVGMSAFFTAVVRAPLTGILLATELTGSFSLLLPMVIAGVTAMLIPQILGSSPIYDSLKERTLRLDAGAAPQAGG